MVLLKFIAPSELATVFAPHDSPQVPVVEIVKAQPLIVPVLGVEQSPLAATMDNVELLNSSVPMVG